MHNGTISFRTLMKWGTEKGRIPAWDTPWCLAPGSSEWSRTTNLLHKGEFLIVHKFLMELTIHSTELNNPIRMYALKSDRSWIIVYPSLRSYELRLQRWWDWGCRPGLPTGNIQTTGKDIYEKRWARLFRKDILLFGDQAFRQVHTTPLPDYRFPYEKLPDDVGSS